jgi:hypothetical protein
MNSYLSVVRRKVQNAQKYNHTIHMTVELCHGGLIKEIEVVCTDVLGRILTLYGNESLHRQFIAISLSCMKRYTWQN